MPTRQNDRIRHVAVLMLENRSFDQMLGDLREVHGAKLDGVNRRRLCLNHARWNEVYQQSETRTLCIAPDPKHELENVLRQIGKLPELPQHRIGVGQRLARWLKAQAQCVFSYRSPTQVMMDLAKGGAYEGAFVYDYAQEYPRSTTPQRQEIMGYYPLDFLPALHALAREFTICDRWFSSVPGPTWTNRFFVHSGTSLSRVSMPTTRDDILRMRPYDQHTVYERLNERNRTWRIYFGDIPQSLVLTRQLNHENLKNYFPMGRFYDDAAGPESKFPDYCFIEPSYFFSNANDDHPPHNAMHAQCLIADVYNALRRNDELWRSTLLVVVYAQHGGFFDHVEPPAATCPDDLTDEYTFCRLGVRVPAILVSPWLRKGVCSTRFDHASLVKYISEKWELGPLGRRVAQANSIDDVFRGVVELRPDTLARIDDSAEMEAARQQPGQIDERLNGHQLALLAFCKGLAASLDRPIPPTVSHTQSTRDMAAEMEEGKRVVQSFIEQAQNKMGQTD
ncbi:MAG: alkaline phosphatase family protein [Pirellulales bacterium]